ncbi:hypothetical protein [Actinomycetospora soli]|uniref:hypothetical protein n=1 Tax=Actinomycetospora soli TaxID=2893887 RepID=UPI001E334AE7|nr:hypothetical protein [Actinomycetospora soli]MCD2191507.1 hypothetical protein [Actinomycetospora soli]
MVADEVACTELDEAVELLADELADLGSELVDRVLVQVLAQNLALDRVRGRVLVDDALVDLDAGIDDDVQRRRARRLDEVQSAPRGELLRADDALDVVDVFVLGDDPDVQTGVVEHRLLVAGTGVVLESGVGVERVEVLPDWTLDGAHRCLSSCCSTGIGHGAGWWSGAPRDVAGSAEPSPARPRRDWPGCVPRHKHGAAILNFAPKRWWVVPLAGRC